MSYMSKWSEVKDQVRNMMEAVLLCRSTQEVRVPH